MITFKCGAVTLLLLSFTDTYIRYFYQIKNDISELTDPYKSIFVPESVLLCLVLEF